MKHVMRFDKKGKLAPRYIRTFLITKNIYKVAYQLDLLESLRAIHLVFHVSLLTKYILNESHVLKNKSIQINQKLTYKE